MSDPDPRAKHDLEQPASGAPWRLAVGLVILLVVLPALALPSRFGVIPYAYSHEFETSPEFLRYCICLLGSWLTFLPTKPPWDLPVPKVVGAGWQVAAAILFVALVWVGTGLLKTGWSRVLKNRDIARRHRSGS